MAKEYLDKDGLLYFWQKIKNNFALKSHTHTKSEITDFPTIPGASSTTPKMDGTAAVGSESSFARGDHVHPSDTSKADVLIVTIGDNISDNYYQIDKTYAEINSAVSSGASVVVTDGDTTNPFVGHTGINGAIVMAFGISATMSGTGVLYGYLILPNNTAMYVNQTTIIPTKTSDLTNDSNFISDSSYVHTDNNYTNSDKTKLDSLTITNGVIDASNLPSYVDDVIEAYARSGQTALSSTWLSLTSGGAALTPETGKIYVLMADSGDYAANTQFRWSGTAYVKLADGGVSSITNAEIDTIVAS